jgi:hypothetical protein
MGILLLLRQVAQHNISSLPCEGDCDRFSDSAIPAGDERHLVSEPAKPLIRFLAVIGLLMHMSREARMSNLSLFMIGFGPLFLWILRSRILNGIFGHIRLLSC